MLQRQIGKERLTVKTTYKVAHSQNLFCDKTCKPLEPTVYFEDLEKSPFVILAMRKLWCFHCVFLPQSIVIVLILYHLWFPAMGFACTFFFYQQEKENTCNICNLPIWICETRPKGKTEETKSVTKVRKDILYIYKLHRKQTHTCVHIYTYFDNQILFSIPCTKGDGGTRLLAEDRQATNMMKEV